MITIKKFKNTLLDEIRQLEITEYQKDYVNVDFDEILKMVQHHPNMNVFGIYNDNIIVGFACCLLDDDGDMNLLKFMIDYRYQGNGYAKVALGLILDLMKPFAAKEELWLSVHPQNVVAIKLYKEIGFLQQKTQFDADDEIFSKYIFA